MTIEEKRTPAAELDSFLETIEPELRVMTRLFGFPESVWEGSLWREPSLQA